MSENTEVVTKQFLDKEGLNALWEKICQTFVGVNGGTINGDLNINGNINSLTQNIGHYSFNEETLYTEDEDCNQIESGDHNLNLIYNFEDESGEITNTPISTFNKNQTKFYNAIGVNGIMPLSEYLNIGDSYNTFGCVYSNSLSSGINTDMNILVGGQNIARFHYNTENYTKSLIPADNKFFIGSIDNPINSITANSFKTTDGGFFYGDLSGHAVSATTAINLRDNPEWDIENFANDGKVKLTVGGKSSSLDMRSLLVDTDNADTINVLRTIESNDNSLQYPAKRPLIHTLTTDNGTLTNRIIRSRLSKSNTVDELFYEAYQKYLSSYNLHTSNFAISQNDTLEMPKDFVGGNNWVFRNLNKSLTFAYYGFDSSTDEPYQYNVIKLNCSKSGIASILPGESNKTLTVDIGNSTDKFGTLYCRDIECDNLLNKVKPNVELKSDVSDNYITLTNDNGNVLNKNEGLKYTITDGTSGELKVSGKTTINDNAVLESNKLYFNNYGSYVGTENNRISNGYFDRIESYDVHGYNVGIKCDEWGIDPDTGAGYIKQVHDVNFYGNLVYNDNNEVEGVNLGVPAKIESEGLSVNNVIDISKKSAEIIDPEWPDWPQYVDYGHISVNGEGADIVINNKSVKNVQADWNTTDTNDDSYIRNKPTSLKNPCNLTIGDKNYDGSEEVKVTATDLGLSKVFDYKGITTTNISDGSTTKPIIINGESYTQKIGDVVIVNGDTDKEYFWNGTKWEELGRTIDLSGYAPVSHTHSKSEITDFPSSLKNPYSLTIQGNGTTLTNGVYDGSASKIVNITAASIGAASTADVEESLYKTIYAAERDNSNPGILVKTSVGETSNAMISVKITGNAYCANGGTKPILTVLEFYNYYNGGRANPRIINISGTHFGIDLGTIKLFNYDSKVCLWIPQTGNYQSFNVFANWTNSSGVDNNINIVESLTKSNVPSTATYLVEFTPNIVAYDGDNTSSNGGHTHTVNATTSTTEVAAKTHSHTVTATGSVSSSFTGTQTTTGNNTSGATVASSGHTHTTDTNGSHSHTI